jgi:GDPmannose 4,6-dehydratase
MWLMLQQDEPGDYVVGTGEAHSVREFLDEAFSYVNLNERDLFELGYATRLNRGAGLYLGL